MADPEWLTDYILWPPKQAPATPNIAEMPSMYQMGAGISEPIVTFAKEMAEQGNPVPNIPIVVQPPVAAEQLMQVGAKLGGFITSPNTLNGGIALLSVRTAGKSALGYIYTKDPAAKFLFAVAFLCSGTAAGAAGTSYISKTICEVNRVGLIGEGMAEILYHLGRDAQRQAEERAKNNPNFILQAAQTQATKGHRKAMRQTKIIGGRPLAYTPSSGVVQYYRIVVDNLVFALTIYGYYKFIRIGYQKIRQLVAEKKAKVAKVQNSKLVNKAAKFIIIYSHTHYLRNIRNNRNIYSTNCCLFSTV